MNFVADKAVLFTYNQALRLGWHIKHEGSKTDYESDVSDEEWGFCAPYFTLIFTLMKENAAPRDDTLRGLFNAVRYMNRAGCPWRMIPNDLPPWHTVQQQAQRWIKAGCFEAMAHDLREVLRVAAEKPAEPLRRSSSMDARSSPPQKVATALAPDGV